MDHMCRTWHSGQGCINKLIIISIEMYVLKQSGIGGFGHFCNLKLIYLEYLLYSTGCGIEWCSER